MSKIKKIDELQVVDSYTNPKEVVLITPNEDNIDKVIELLEKGYHSVVTYTEQEAQQIFNYKRNDK